MPVPSTAEQFLDAGRRSGLLDPCLAVRRIVRSCPRPAQRAPPSVKGPAAPARLAERAGG